MSMIAIDTLGCATTSAGSLFFLAQARAAPPNALLYRISAVALSFSCTIYAQEFALHAHHHNPRDRHYQVFPFQLTAIIVLNFATQFCALAAEDPDALVLLVFSAGICLSIAFSAVQNRPLPHAVRLD